MGSELGSVCLISCFLKVIYELMARGVLGVCFTGLVSPLRIQ